MIKTTAFILFLNALILTESFSQCSDAGVCTIGRHQVNESVIKSSHIYFGFNYGASGKDPDINGNTNDISYGSVKLEADLDLKNGFRVNGSIPYSFISGPLGENNGIGDLEVVFSKMFRIKKKHLLTFFLGGKFATGKVNSSDSLPQRYMPGLGTNDLIVGAVYTGVNYFFGIGYQKPFGRSANYITRLKRGDDVFFRAGFFEEFSKVSIKAEVLTILRLQKSSVLSGVSPENFVEVSNSNEAQVNLLGTVGYKASDEISITVQAALPFLKRDYNFDGLKRKFSVGAMVSYNF
ncbi:MAG TPA: hypothetical protein PK605_05545 [Ignavibacteria bacterium]|nr:hypothetical protein [Bacteroidota bacterium]HRE09243.1 hypothetical protein [Ignavibacteria bacterium]HRF66205.1 hypothetical protein [Ignavibacteria bacterium]HRJ03849.1 hypothetical protein [Ignavibacteria bacterium]